jgi:cell filamentation protein
MSDVDPYLIPGIGVLRNLVNAHSGQALNAAENDWVTFRFLQLQATPLTAEGTVSQ